MPALLMRMSRRPNFSAAPLTKARHAASVPTSACVRAPWRPPVSSSAATRSPRSPSRSQNATLAPSATKRLTVASPIPDAPPVTAATLPSSLPMFVTFHCVAKRGSTIRPFPNCRRSRPMQNLTLGTRSEVGFVPSGDRHPNRLQPRMCTARARFHPVKIRAHIVPGQVQDLAAELPIFLDLCLGLRRSSGELAVRIAGRRDPPHRRFESGVLEVEVNPKLRAQVGMPIRDHVDPFDRCDLLDILQALERLDRRAYDDVLVGPRRVFGGVAGAVALVFGVRPLARDTPVSDRRILRQADDRARLFGVFHLGHLDAHDALIQNAWD